jgi:hypothetical protein
MGEGCRPGHRKGAFILHGEVELQVLASVVVVSLGAGIGSPWEEEIHVYVTLQPFFRGFVIMSR